MIIIRGLNKAFGEKIIFSNFDLENLYSNDYRNDKTEPRPNIS